MDAIKFFTWTTITGLTTGTAIALLPEPLATKAAELTTALVVNGLLLFTVGGLCAYAALFIYSRLIR